MEALEARGHFEPMEVEVEEAVELLKVFNIKFSWSNLRVNPALIIRRIYSKISTSQNL